MSTSDELPVVAYFYRYNTGNKNVSLKRLHTIANELELTSLPVATAIITQLRTDLEASRLECERLRVDAERFNALHWHWDDERDMGPGGRYWTAVMCQLDKPASAGEAIDKAMKVKPLRLNPMHQRPGAGRRITVWMRDGQRLECHATKVVSNAGSGIVIYHKRNAIDEMKAEGWIAAAIRAGSE